MFKEILNSEGVEELSRQQMKSLDGGGYLTNYQCTGNLYYATTGAGDGPTGFECTAQYQPTFLGSTWGIKPKELASHQVFPCPAGMVC
jgi:hypothetical protein